MTQHQIINRLKQNKEVLARKFHVVNIFLFGSYATNRATPRSDIDLLIDIPSHSRGWNNHLALERFLARLLNHKIDLVYTDSVNPVVLEDIGKDMINVS